MIIVHSFFKAEEQESLESLSQSIDELEQVILKKLGNQMDVKPTRILLDMRREIKSLKGD